MMLERRFWRVRPQEVDPLSWLTGRLVPIVFGGVNLVYGGVFTVLTWNASAQPFLQVIGVVLCTFACVMVYVLTRPLRAPFGWRGGGVVMAIATLSFVISALGYANSMLPIETWWAPFGMALVMTSLCPYLPARAIVILGGAALAVAVPVATVFIEDEVSSWGPISTALIILSPMILGLVAVTAFSVTVVSRFLPLIEARSSTLLPLDPPRGAEAERAERERVARLTARAAPFLRKIARTGEVSATDRTVAGQLARRLRDDLVTQSNLTWLDSVAAGSRIVVVDPEQRAARMRASQRTALRGLLRAILDLEGTDAGSILVELRAHEDGSTAVGLSLDIELPEGRRVMHLAPYYLALRGSVNDLEWNDDQFLRVTFNLPSPAD